MKKRIHNVTKIRYSCLTGKPVWLYQGPSKKDANMAYYRACRRELERVRNWGETLARMKSNIRRLLSSCTASLPVTAVMGEEQKSAAEQLTALLEEDTACHLEFYNHILEMRRRAASGNTANRCYDKQGGHG